jgi:hypothetical protein
MRRHARTARRDAPVVAEMDTYHKEKPVRRYGEAFAVAGISPPGRRPRRQKSAGISS